jgi:hypothetical protein
MSVAAGTPMTLLIECTLVSRFVDATVYIEARRIGGLSNRAILFGDTACGAPKNSNPCYARDKTLNRDPVCVRVSLRVDSNFTNDDNCALGILQMFRECLRESSCLLIRKGIQGKRIIYKLMP